MTAVCFYHSNLSNELGKKTKAVNKEIRGYYMFTSLEDSIITKTAIKGARRDQFLQSSIE